MYTRNYRPTFSVSPPPDYSGTAMAGVPAPALPREREERTAGEKHDETAFPPVRASAETGSPAGMGEEGQRTAEPTFARFPLEDRASYGREKKRPLSLPAVRALLPSASGVPFADDDWLLLGLILLFLTGSADDVNEGRELLLLLGFLFFAGRAGSTSRQNV